MYDEDTQDLINDTFKGDAKRFEEARAEGRRETISWDDVVSVIKTHPDLNQEALRYIDTLLGYLPRPYLTIRQEPFIRTILYQFHSGMISDHQMLDQIEEHVKLIRNEHFKDHSHISYPDFIYTQYDGFPPLIKQQIRARLEKSMGYAPELNASIGAECMLILRILDDECHLPETFSVDDIQAITIIKYREALLKDGKAAADASALIAMDYAEFNKGR